MQQKKTDLSTKIIQESKISFPIAVKRARKAILYDYNQNKYFDFYLNNGSNLLGYSYKKLFTQIKNVLSHGFLNPYPHHLKMRAQKSVQIFLERFFGFSSKNYIPYFFHSHLHLQETLFSHVNKEELAFIPIKNACKSGCSKKKFNVLVVDNQLYALPQILIHEWDFILMGNVLANGYPSCTLVEIKKKPDFSSLNDNDFPIFYYQAIIETTHALWFEKYNHKMEKILSSFQKGIEYLGFGAFTINIDSQKYFQLVQFCLSKCILLNPQEPLFYLSLQTEWQHIQYLFSCINLLVHQGENESHGAN